MSDIIDRVTSAPDAFTSWDKCMSKAYCKCVTINLSHYQSSPPNTTIDGQSLSESSSVP